MEIEQFRKAKRYGRKERFIFRQELRANPFMWIFPLIIFLVAFRWWDVNKLQFCLGSDSQNRASKENKQQQTE